MGFVDNLIAVRILYKLVTPFNKSDAYKLGIIDEKGVLLKQPSEFTTAEEKNAYDMLDRLVFNLKRLLAKLPGGDNKLKSLAAAYFLVKENYLNHEYSDDADMETLAEQLQELLATDAILVEETLEIVKFLSLYEEGEGGIAGGPGGANPPGINTTGSGLPANHTGPEVSTDQPVIKNKKRVKFITRAGENK